MTLPSDPTLFLAHCKAHKTQTQTTPCKELKMPTHNPPTPADEYLSSLVQRISNRPLFNSKPTHHPADRILISFKLIYIRIFILTLIINQKIITKKLSIKK